MCAISASCANHKKASISISAVVIWSRMELILGYWFSILLRLFFSAMLRDRNIGKNTYSFNK